VFSNTNFEAIIIRTDVKQEGTNTTPSCLYSGGSSNTWGDSNYMTGYFYVPDSTLSDYKTANNWSHWSSKFKGISELPT
jgi:hypothetical protein